MEQTGKVIQLCEKRTGISQTTGNPWVSQDFVLETVNEQYPRKIVLNMYGDDKIKMFDLHVGDVAKVSFDIDAREHNGRWFNSIRAWKVEKIYKDSATAATAQPSAWPTASQAQPSGWPTANQAQSYGGYQPQPITPSRSSQGDIPF